MSTNKLMCEFVYDDDNFCERDTEEIKKLLKTVYYWVTCFYKPVIHIEYIVESGIFSGKF